MAKELWSQASVRSYRKWKDQHGQEWGADIEKKTGHPCSPISPFFSAPMAVPQKYLTMDPNDQSRILIDYDRWIADLESAHREHDALKLSLAAEIGGPRAADEYEHPSPLLLRRLGPAPLSPEVVHARKAGNKWIRGVAQPDGTAYPKPDWALPFFPDEQKPEPRNYADVETHDAGEFAEFPVYSGGRWNCTDKQKFADKADAIAHQQLLDAQAVAA